MSRRVLLVGAASAAVVAILLGGGSILMCLGPLGVTGVQCAAGYNVTHDPDWSPGPGTTELVLIGVACLFVLAAILPAVIDRPRTAGALGLLGVFGGAAGAAVYEATRLRVLSGPTSTGQSLTVDVPSNADGFRLAAVVGATLVLILAAAILRVQASRHAIAGPRDIPER